MQYPLCVDLDGTLIKTDCLFESLLLFLKTKPWLFFLAFFWLLRGRSYLKQRLTEVVQLPIADLPYRLDLLEWLQAEHKRGRKLTLITASSQTIAEQVAAHLGIFVHVKGSDGNINLKGNAKRAYLDEVFGKGQYDYAGDSSADLKVWSGAQAAVVIGSAALVKKCQKIIPIAQHFETPQLTLKVFLKAIRVHQYAKNGLIFVPLLLGHFFLKSSLLLETILAFISFSLLASSVYLLNDLFDLPADRKHRKKCLRAIAAGTLSIPLAGVLMLVFLILAFAVSLLLPLNFQAVLIVYYVLTLLYSFVLKRRALLDVFTLSALYTLRILAGMAILGVGFSSWLIIFSLFFFTSLAFVKRYIELAELKIEGDEIAHGRGYHVDHLLMVTIFGVTSGYISILVFALYINSEKANLLYNNANWLYLICPVLLYWVSRVWLKASVGFLHEDPVIFAIKDKLSYLLMAIVAVILVFATL